MMLKGHKGLFVAPANFQGRSDSSPMSDPKDRLFRHLALLRLIPRAPKSISTTELLKKLRAENFDIDQRTLQRDLIGRLGLDFPLDCDESRKPFRWSFPSDMPRFDFPALDTPTALAFALAQSHLNKVLPPSILELLAPHFDLAHRQLQGLEHNPLANWPGRVRVIPNGKALLPAAVETTVWSEVAMAVLETRQLDIRYHSRSKAEHKALRIHPSGIVSRHAVSYLVGRVEGYSDVRQFAMHRIQQATCLDEACVEPAGFELDTFIRSGFNHKGQIGQQRLVADVAPSIAWMLHETPLSAEQSLTPLAGSDWQRLQATVPDDQETLWWVFGLGESIRLHEPQPWIDAIKDKLDKVTALYATPENPGQPSSTCDPF